MQVSYMSDLHLDSWLPLTKDLSAWEKNTINFVRRLVDTDKTDKEILCLAGDYSHYNIQTRWMLEELSDHYKYILAVLGNHDYYLLNSKSKYLYKYNSQNRIDNLRVSCHSLDNVHVFNEFEIIEIKGKLFSGGTMWYPLETIEQKIFFQNASNDSIYIMGADIKELHKKDQGNYQNILHEKVDVMISHMPVINIDSHFEHNSTAGYLTPLKDLNANNWIFGHSHEQKVYEKPYCTFYMNTIGYKHENMKLEIKSFEI